MRPKENRSHNVTYYVGTASNASDNNGIVYFISKEDAPFKIYQVKLQRELTSFPQDLNSA